MLHRIIRLQNILMLRTICTLFILLLTSQGSLAQGDVNISKLNDFDSSSPSILNFAEGQIKKRPERNGRSSDTYNKHVKTLGDIIYDYSNGQPVLVVTSNMLKTVSAAGINKLVDHGFKNEFDKKELLKGSELSPDSLFLVKTKQGDVILCKIISVKRNNIEIAWVSSKPGSSLFSKNQIDALNGVPIQAAPISGEIVLSYSRNNAFNFSSRKSTSYFVPENNFDQKKDSKILAGEFKKQADLLLLNSKEPTLIVASEKAELIGRGLLSNFAQRDLSYLLKRPTFLFRDIKPDMVFLLQDLKKNFILMRVIGVSDKEISLHWIYEPNGVAVFPKISGEKTLKEVYSNEQLDKALMRSLLAKDSKGFKDALSAGANANLMGGRGFNILQEAIIKGDVDAASMLIDAGADINAGNEKDLYPLHIAVELGNYKVVKLLVDKGINLGLLNSEGQTALELAGKTNRRNENIIQYLMSNGSTSNSIFMASEVGDIERVKQYIKDGYDLNEVDDDGNNALMLAAKNGNVELGKTLLGSEINLETSSPDLKGDVLTIATRYDNKDFVELLLNDQRLTEASKVKALYEAGLRRNHEIVRYILDTGLEISSTSDISENPYQHALAYGTDQVVQAYADHNYNIPLWSAARLNRIADIAKRISQVDDLNMSMNNNGERAIDLAVKNGHIEAVALLIKNGADTDLPNKTYEKFTPLHYAAKNGFADIAQLLINNNADLNSINIYQRTPLYEAVANSQYEIVQILLQSGADIKILPNGKSSILDSTSNERIKSILREYGAE